MLDTIDDLLVWEEVRIGLAVHFCIAEGDFVGEGGFAEDTFEAFVTDGA